MLHQNRSMSYLIRCGACVFFDCGGYCKCVCHIYEPKKSTYEIRDPTESEMKKGAGVYNNLRTEEAAMEGLSSLFG